MDRDLIYPGQIGLVENFLDAFKSSMVAIGITSEAVLGQSTQVFGLAASALSSTAVAGSAFAILLGRGAIFSYQETDSNAYGVLGADTATNLLKTGINLTETQIGITDAAPATAGQSINYLVSAQFLETDTNAVNLPFYNAGGTPTITTENATRTQRVIFSVTGGTAAATGLQTTPAAPSGSVPIYVVTITNGQTAVLSTNISVASGAPFISNLGTVASSVNNLSAELTSEVATRTAQEGNLKTIVAIYSNTTLVQSQQGSFVEIVAGSAIILNFPTPVGQAGAFFRVFNASNYTQTFKTPLGGIFIGPGGSNTASVTILPGQMVEATSDNASWVLSSLGSPAPYYTASQSGTISTAPSTTYAVASAVVSFPAFSRTGAFRVRGRMMASGQITAGTNSVQNFLSKLSDGTNACQGAYWLQSGNAGNAWGVSDYFEPNFVYSAGSTVTFEMSVETFAGSASFTISGCFFELNVVEA